MENSKSESLPQVNEKLINIEELSVYLNFKKSRIRYEVFMGTIPHLKIGRSIRFSKSQVDAWLSTKQKGGAV